MVTSLNERLSHIFGPVSHLPLKDVHVLRLHHVPVVVIIGKLHQEQSSGLVEHSPSRPLTCTQPPTSSFLRTEAVPRLKLRILTLRFSGCAGMEVYVFDRFDDAVTAL
jgi:hypothetical protein